MPTLKGGTKSKIALKVANLRAKRREKLRALTENSQQANRFMKHATIQRFVASAMIAAEEFEARFKGNQMPAPETIKGIKKSAVSFAKEQAGRSFTITEIEQQEAALSALISEKIIAAGSNINPKLASEMGDFFASRYIRNNAELENEILTQKLMSKAMENKGKFAEKLISRQILDTLNLELASSHALYAVGFREKEFARAAAIVTPYIKKAASLYATGKTWEGNDTLSSAFSALIKEGTDKTKSRHYIEHLGHLLQELGNAQAL
ncbi:MAG TPA: hypothetical protein VJH23_01595 [archaeon]|nr:hypothetical protein [archaeon]